VTHVKLLDGSGISLTVGSPLLAGAIASGRWCMGVEVLRGMASVPLLPVWVTPAVLPLISKFMLASSSLAMLQLRWSLELELKLEGTWR
jgi:hypothetical protein